MSSTEVANPTSRRELLKAAIVLILGVVGIFTFSRIYEFDASDTGSIVGLTVLAAAVASVVGVGVMYLCRNRSIGSQAGLLFLIAGLGAGLAALWNANEMFLSRHDLGVLMIVLVTSGAIASFGAIVFGRRINNTVGRIITVTREIKADSAVSLPSRGTPRELAQLARELESMSHRLRFEQDQTEKLERSRRELVAFVSNDVHLHLEHLQRITSSLDANSAQEVVNELTAIRNAVRDMSELLIDTNDQGSSVAS